MHINEYYKKERNKKKEKKRQLPTLVPVGTFHSDNITVINPRQHCPIKYKTSVQTRKHCPAMRVSNEQCSGYNRYAVIKRLYPCSLCDNLTSVNISHTVNCTMLHYTLLIHVPVLTSLMNFFFFFFIISLYCF
jgi:hypothetical protein